MPKTCGALRRLSCVCQDLDLPCSAMEESPLQALKPKIRLTFFPHSARFPWVLLFCKELAFPMSPSTWCFQGFCVAWLDQERCTGAECDSRRERGGAHADEPLRCGAVEAELSGDLCSHPRRPLFHSPALQGPNSETHADCLFQLNLTVPRF